MLTATKPRLTPVTSVKPGDTLPNGAEIIVAERVAGHTAMRIATANGERIFGLDERIRVARTSKR